MRALVLRDGDLLVTDVIEPRPGPGQMLVAPLATGICGSDLSAWKHTDEFLQASIDSGTELFVFDKSADLVMGHEFTSTVLEIGPGVLSYKPGDRIVTRPSVLDLGTHRCVGYATNYPGALAERVVVQADGDRQHPIIPEDMDPYLAALTEPLTVGFNAVARSRATPSLGAVVIGCGPVGLGAVVGLLERGISPIVVSDPSPMRREIALQHGAHIAVDPTEQDPIEAWSNATGDGRRLLVFECSGKKGMLNLLLYSVPHSTTILVSGSCMVDDTIRPVVGIYKNVRIDFCMGPDPELGPTDVDEFEKTLDRLHRGAIDGRRLVTAWAPLDAAGQAFEALRPNDPGSIEHFKILVRHDLEGQDLIPGPAKGEVGSS